MEGDPTCNFAMCVFEQKRVCRWFFSNAALFMPSSAQKGQRLCVLFGFCARPLVPVHYQRDQAPVDVRRSYTLVFSIIVGVITSWIVGACWLPNGNR